jgi:hypothetical protein
MRGRSLRVSRRAALQLGVATAWSLSALAFPQNPQPATATPGHAAVGEIETEDRRFRFAPITPLPDFAPLGRLEAVWASPSYLTITDCIVSYIGADPFRLTPEEYRIVEIAEAGGATGDPRDLYLLILSASTRIDPPRLDAKLAELGRPIVTASLALAPEAPQAAQFMRWLEETA